MGHIVHHAIVVTSWRENITSAHDEASRLGCSVSPILGPVVNGYSSFMVGPDGSKSGWEQSDEGDSRREKLIAWLKAEGTLDWVEIKYGGDDSDAIITRHAWISGLSNG